MNCETSKPLHPERLQVDGPGEQQVASVEADDAVAPPVARPAAAPKSGGPPSEDDQVEAGFDNMPV